jgi:hypothetical protein
MPLSVLLLLFKTKLPAPDIAPDIVNILVPAVLIKVNVDAGLIVPEIVNADVVLF